MKNRCVLWIWKKGAKERPKRTKLVGAFASIMNCLCVYSAHILYNNIIYTRNENRNEIEKDTTTIVTLSLKRTTTKTTAQHTKTKWKCGGTAHRGVIANMKKKQ